MLTFLRPYRTSIIIALALMLIELAVELINPLLMSYIINEGIVGENMSAVLRWGGIMLGMAFLAFAAGIVNSFFAANVSQGFGYTVRMNLFRRIQSFSIAGFDRFSTPSLITRVTSDVTQLQNLLFMGLRIAMRTPLTLIGGLIMAFVIDAQLALILITAFPVVLIFIIVMMKTSYRLFRAVQNQLDRTNGVVRENLIGMRLIKAFVRGEHEAKRFTKDNQELMRRTMAALQLIELMAPILLLVMNLAVLVILWVGNWQFQANGIEIGDIVAVVNYATRITGSFSMLSMILMNISRARASAARVSEVLDAEEETHSAPSLPSEQTRAVTEGTIAFTNVSFQYPGTSIPVLKSLSFTIHSGYTVAVMGATGSGKSTLFQLIPRLYQATSGEVCVGGMNVDQMDEGLLRMQIGYVPQESVLFTGTIADNLRWGKEDATMIEIIEAAKAAQIHETIKQLPRQYDTVVGQKGVNLSGGQKQRLSIARALIRKPRILLLDDSTSALDLKTEANLMAALRRYSFTTMIITQKVSSAMEADSILLLDHGAILAQGKHDQLLRESALYRDIVASQFGKEAVE